MSGWETAQGLHLLVDGVPQPVTASDLARWLCLGRGNALRLDEVYAEQILAGCAEDVRVRRRVAALNSRPRPLGDGS